MRDIRVGVAFDVLNVVSGVFSRDASVFVFSRVRALKPRYFRHLYSNPIEGSPVIDKGG
jgi:hypothetical protein